MVFLVLQNSYQFYAIKNVATWLFLVATGLVVPGVSMSRESNSVSIHGFPKGRIFHVATKNFYVATECTSCRNTEFQNMGCLRVAT